MGKQCDDKLMGVSGRRGKQGKYNFSRTKPPILFQLVWNSPLATGLGVRAKALSKFLKDPSFAEGFGGKAE